MCVFSFYYAQQNDVLAKTSFRVSGKLRNAHTVVKFLHYHLFKIHKNGLT